MNPILPSKLERLDVPGKEGTWKLVQAMAGFGKRREEFKRLIADGWREDPETIPKLRTLIDLGLWGDLEPESGLMDEQERERIGTEFEQVMRKFLDISFPGGPPPDQAQKLLHQQLLLGAWIAQPGSSWFGNKEKARAKEKAAPLEILHLMLEAGMDPDIEVNRHGLSTERLAPHLLKLEHHKHVLLVFRAGANPRCQPLSDYTLAHLIVCRGSHWENLELLRKMVAQGLDINDVGYDVRHSDKRIEPSVDIQNPQASAGDPSRSWLPPVAIAIKESDHLLIKTLVQMGARLDWPGYTAFHVLVGPDNKDMNQPLEKMHQLMNDLMDWGAPIDEADSLGRTPLWLSIPDKPEKALWLIEQGARVDVAIGDDGTGHRQTLMEHLIRAGADQEEWRAVTEQIAKRFPQCWAQPCFRQIDGFETVADLALHRGGAWGAMASADLLIKHIDLQPDEPAPRSRPRL